MIESLLDRVDDTAEESEIAIVKAQPPREFPDSFDRVEVRTVGWQKIQSEIGAVLLAPGQMELGSMVSGVVADDHHAAPFADAGCSKCFHEFQEGFSIEAARLLTIVKQTVLEPYGPEISYAAPRRMVIQDRIFDLRWYPHTAA